jgi:hypothetical protein
MAEFDDEWKGILNVLITAPIAWQTAEEIAAAVGRDVEDTTDVLSVMDEAGWIAVWDGQAVPLITLSPLAAERLHVVLIEVGPDQTPRWALAGESQPPAPRARNVCRAERNARLDDILDPAAFPEYAGERAEQLAAQAASGRGRRGLPAARHVEDLPPPSQFLGMGLTPWPGPMLLESESPCPVCGNRPLSPQVYCLYCDRWGLDDLLALLIKRAVLPRPAAAATSLPASSLSQQSVAAQRHQTQKQLREDRKGRKARRKARRTACKDPQRGILA